MLSTEELRACGLSRSAITTRRRRAQLHRLYTGVWAVGHPSPPYEGRMLAAVKACGPAAVLSHWSAAELWGFVEEQERRPQVTVVGRSTRVVPGLVVHRTSCLDPRDRARHRGVPTTGAARTLLDLAGVADTEVVRRAVRTAQGKGRVHVRQLIEVVERLGPRRGSRKLASLIATGPAPTRSVLEDIVLELLLEARFAHPDVNKPLVIAGRRIVPDFRWPEQRLILEVDGARVARRSGCPPCGCRAPGVPRGTRRAGPSCNVGAGGRPPRGDGRAGPCRWRASSLPTMRRSDQRRDAVFALYQRDVTGRPLDELLDEAKPFTRELALGTDAQLAELDEEISRLSRGWELDRIAALEKSIMRVALHEMREGVPVEVAIDEAVNLAREYCGADAPGFVNGILGSAARESAEAAS